MLKGFHAGGWFWQMLQLFALALTDKSLESIIVSIS